MQLDWTLSTRGAGSIDGVDTNVDAARRSACATERSAPAPEFCKSLFQLVHRSLAHVAEQAVRSASPLGKLNHAPRRTS